MRPVPGRVLAAPDRPASTRRRSSTRSPRPAVRRAHPRRVRRARLGLTEASVIMEEINRSGGHSAACHAQMYTMGAVLRHGSDEQKRAYLPGDRRAASCACRRSRSPSRGGLGHHAASPRPRRRDGDDYVIDGHKNWTSRIEQSDLLLLLARTDADDEVAADRGPQPVPGRPARVRRAARRAGGHPGAHDVQLRHQPGSLPGAARARRQPDRRGGRRASAT